MRYVFPVFLCALTAVFVPFSVFCDDDVPGKKLIRLSQIFGCPADILLQSSNEDQLPLSSYTRIVVETDEENPVQVAIVESDNVHAAEGYRVRLTPKYN